MPFFEEKMSDVNNVEILKHWDLCVKILGKHLHTGTTLINVVMKVIQKAFKIKESKIIQAAYGSWMVLMDNFALNPVILNNLKRIKLLMKLFVVPNSNSYSEAAVTQKFNAWWHLIFLLGPNVSVFCDIVLVPFLRFCYGPKYSSKCPSDVLNDKDQSPMTPLSPAKKYSGLDKLCLDALVQLFASRPLSTAIPKTHLSGSLKNTVFTYDSAMGNAEVIFHALLEATALTKPSNRSELVKLEAVWEGVSKVLHEAAIDNKLNEEGE